MITKLILNTLFAILHFFLSGLQSSANVTLPTGVTNAVGGVSAWINAFSIAAPTTALYICIAAVITLEIAIFYFKSIMFGIKRIPFMK